ncbi:MAG: hypothetical protein C5B54_10920, partial [Acidobacteria bacterium]
MPRGNFNDVSKSFGFQEGYLHITRAYSCVFQYPANSQTKVQSPPFTALVWEYEKLDNEWNPIDDEQVPDPIVIRMGDVDKCRPGKLAEKDFDNLNVDPEDLGKDVGTE